MNKITDIDTSHVGTGSRARAGLYDTLFQPYTLSPALRLSNRVVMAPMTRSMAGEGLAPTAAMAAYYARRAGAGLIISEATIIRPDGQGYPQTPGLFSDEQVAGWRAVTSAVHEAGGRMFAQLWHVGRVSHPVFLDGKLPVAPSPVPLSGRVPRTNDLRYGTPRGLASDEIPELVRGFAEAAGRAMAAGFDGVEIHGANGYLIDQFLHYHTNRRRDEYGGTPERMARFAWEVVDAVAAVTGNERVGMRLSPGAHFNMTGDPRDADVFRVLLKGLESRRIAYVHTGVVDDSTVFEEIGGTAGRFLRENYRGTLIGNGSYSPAAAAAAIEKGRFELVAIGRGFIANPDLMDRLRSGEEPRPYEESMLLSLD